MQTNSPWWQGFFVGLIVEAQRKWSSIEQTEAEAEFLMQELSPVPGAKIADVPCGNGRLSLALAAQGVAVTGVDFTAEILADARQAAAERGLTAQFEQRDMRDLPWHAEFDGAFCLGNSFGYFDDAGNREFLRAVARILKPGAKFVLNTGFAAETVFSQLTPRRWFEMDDLICLHDTHYNVQTAQLTSTYRMMQGEKRERKQAVYQIYLCRELLQMLAEAGFAQIETYGSLKREPLAIGSANLWLVGTKSP